MNLRAHLSRNVQFLRRERGWSQEDFADASGSHKTYVGGIERCLRNPTLDGLATASQIGAAALGDKHRR